MKNILENFRSQIELVRKEKHDFYLKHKCSGYKSKEKKWYGHAQHKITKEWHSSKHVNILILKAIFLFCKTCFKVYILLENLMSWEKEQKKLNLEGKWCDVLILLLFI